MDRGKSFGLVFNPLLIAKSKEVIKIIEDIANRHRFGCNDLLLAVFWHSLDSTRQITDPLETKLKDVVHEVATEQDIHWNKQVEYCSSTNQAKYKAANNVKLSDKYPATPSQSLQKVAENTSIILKGSEFSNENNKHRHKKVTKQENPVSTEENVEVISIDDDSEILSGEEDQTHATKTIFAENDECSYFEMDCDEIDENDDVDDEVIATEGLNVPKTSDEVSIGEDRVDITSKISVEQTTLDSIGLRRRPSKMSIQCVDIEAGSVCKSASNQSSNQVSTSFSESTSALEEISDPSGVDTNLHTCSSQSNPAQSTWVDRDGPPRKKRLLDHDKKWHMAPKHNVDQDKYLALPGGIDRNSVSIEDENHDDSNPDDSCSLDRRSQSPPSVGIEIVSGDCDNYKKDSRFRQPQADAHIKSDKTSEEDAKENTEQNEKSKISQCEQRERKNLKGSKLFATRGKFSNLKKPIGLRGSSLGRPSQFLQISKIGRKGFSRKNDEKCDSNTRGKVNAHSTKTKISGRQSKFCAGIQTRGRARNYLTSDSDSSKNSSKLNLCVQTDIQGSSGDVANKLVSENVNNSNDISVVKNRSKQHSVKDFTAKQSKKRHGQSRDTSCRGKSKLSTMKDGKLKSNHSESGDETSSEDEEGFVEEEVEWTTEVNGKEVPNKEIRAGSSNKTPKKTLKGKGKSGKHKETNPHVEVLVMDVDEIKFLDDIPNVIDNELGETSRDQGAADEGNDYDSDVIILD